MTKRNANKSLDYSDEDSEEETVKAKVQKKAKQMKEKLKNKGVTRDSGNFKDTTLSKTFLKTTFTKQDQKKIDEKNYNDEEDSEYDGESLDDKKVKSKKGGNIKDKKTIKKAKNNNISTHHSKEPSIKKIKKENENNSDEEDDDLDKPIYKKSKSKYTIDKNMKVSKVKTEKSKSKPSKSKSKSKDTSTIDETNNDEENGKTDKIDYANLDLSIVEAEKKNEEIDVEEFIEDDSFAEEIIEKREKKKKNKNYVKGKENPNVTELEIDEIKEDPSSELKLGCCVICNNRNVFRAVNTNNIELLDKCIKAREEISDLCESWNSLTPSLDCVSLCMKDYENKEEILDKIIAYYINMQNTSVKKNTNIYHRVLKPQSKLQLIETGKLSKKTFGFEVRSVNMERGNKLGNNAFIEPNSYNYNTGDIVGLSDKIFSQCLENKLSAEQYTELTAKLTNPFSGKNTTHHIPSIDYRFCEVLLTGNQSLASLIVQQNLENIHIGFNKLFLAVLCSASPDDFDITHRASVNKKSAANSNVTPIHAACINSNEKIIEKMINFGGDIFAMDYENRKPIHYAACSKTSNCLQFLHKKMMCNIDEKDKSKNTPLLYAAKANRYETVNYLVTNEANCLAKNKQGFTALHYAALNNDLPMIKLLVRVGNMKVDLPGPDRKTALMIAAENNHINSVKLLIYYDAKVTKKDKFKRTPLLLAVRAGHIKIVSYLLQEGSEFNAGDNSLNSPLHYACAFGWSDIVRILLDAGADVNIVNSWKYSCMEIAILKNHFGIVKRILDEEEVNVNVRFDKGRTLIHHSVLGLNETSYNELYYLISKKNANVNMQDIDGDTILHLIAQYSFEEYLENGENYEIQSKINTIISNRNGRSAFYGYNINNSNDPEIVKLKEEYKNKYVELIAKVFNLIVKTGKADINLKNVLHKTALQIAIERKNLIFIELIIQHNPQIVFVDKSNNSILHLLSEFVFDDNSNSLIKNFIGLLKNSQERKLIVNLYNDNGFSPLLNLAYKYNKELDKYFNNIKSIEKTKLQKIIYQEAKKSCKEENPFAPQNNINISNVSYIQGTTTKMADKDLSEDEEEYDEEDEEDIEEITNQNQLFSQVNNWKGYNKVASKYSISFGNRSENEIINSINLSSKDIEGINLIAVDKLNSFIKNFFIPLIQDLVELGCDLNATTRKLLRFREGYAKTSNDTVIDDNDDDINSIHAMNPKKKVKKINYTHRNTQSNLNEEADNDIENNVSDFNEYHNQLGDTNILMLLIRYPHLDLINFVKDNSDLDYENKDIKNKTLIIHLINNFNAIKSISEKVFYSCFDYLLSKQVNLNCVDYLGNSLCLIAAKSDLFNILEKICLSNDIPKEKKANINQMNFNGENPLIYYVRNKNNSKVNELFEKFDIKINHRDYYDRTVMHYLFNDDKSSENIDNSLIKLILTKRPDINARDFLGRTPLTYLFIKISNEYIDTFIDPIISLSTVLDYNKDVDLSIADNFGNTILHYAAQRGASISSMAIIEKNPNLVNSKNKEGNTPFGYSLIFGHPNYSVILMQKNININDYVMPINPRTEYELLEIEVRKELDEKSKEKIKIKNQEAVKEEDNNKNKIKEGKLVTNSKIKQTNKEEDKNRNNNINNTNSNIGNTNNIVDKNTDINNNNNALTNNISTNSNSLDAKRQKQKDEIKKKILGNSNINKNTSTNYNNYNNYNNFNNFNKFSNYNRNLSNETPNIINSASSINSTMFTKQSLFENNINIAKNKLQVEEDQYNEKITYSSSFNEIQENKYQSQITNEEEYKKVTYFRLCLKKNYQGLLHLLLMQNYSLFKAIEDAIKENSSSITLLVEKCYENESIMLEKNNLGQSLYHLIGLNWKNKHQRFQPKEAFFNLLKFLKTKPLDILENDTLGCNILHYACMHQNSELMSYIFENVNKNKLVGTMKTKNKENMTPFLYAFQGTNINSFVEIKKFFNNKDFVSNIHYNEKVYGEDYYCSPIIHTVRYFSPTNQDVLVSTQGNILLFLIQNGANIMDTDQHGLDCLMHSVINNNFKLFEAIVENCSKQINKQGVDNNGKSLVHHIVSPIEEGSYENAAMLRYALKNNFSAVIQDKMGYSPIDYSLVQKSGVLLNVFREFNIKNPHSNNQQLTRKNSIIESSTWPKFEYDYEQDYTEFHELKRAEFENTDKAIIKPDAIGKFPSKTHFVVKDDALGYYDCLMTKVKIDNGPFGEFMFYKMQIIEDKGKDVYILWTRWGRIGEDGAYQRTGFGKIDEAVKEFKKIFKSKSGNHWENKDKFEKIDKKYQLLTFNQTPITTKDLLDKFDYKNLPKSKIFSNQDFNKVFLFMKDITNSSIFFKVMSGSSIDSSKLNLNNLTGNLLNKAKAILLETKECLEELTKIRDNFDYVAGKKDKKKMEEILSLRFKIQNLSNRYYECIPKFDLFEYVIEPLNLSKINSELMMIYNLGFIEKAVKVLLAARSKMYIINPIDYVFKSIYTDIKEMDHDSKEYKLLLKYCYNKSNSYENYKINNIFKVQRKEEPENLNKYINDKISKTNYSGNNVLLFHGTKSFNFIGILSSGLKIAPPEAPVTGYMFGKGVYFADCLSKSLGYCDSLESYLSNDDNYDENKEKSELRYMLLCEVALGNSLKVFNNNNFDFSLGFLDGKCLF